MGMTATQAKAGTPGARSARAAGNATMRERNDASLLQAIAAGRDETAFGELFRRYEQTAFCLAFQITGSPVLAEEAAQEAFLRVWTRAGTYRPEEGEVRPWLLRIAAREALKMLRRQRKDMKAKELEGGTGAAIAESAASTASGEREELLVALRRSVSELPESARQVIALYFGAGLTQAEIGKELDLSQRAVSDRISGTVDRLRANLAKAGFAAAAPLLGAEHLGEALCSGIPAPPGLAAQTLSRLKDAGADTARMLTRRAAAASGSHTGLVAAVVLAAAAGAGAWYWNGKAPATRPVAPASAETPAPAAVETTAAGSVAPERTEWHWNFEDGAFEDELPRTEGWAYGRGEVSKRKVLASRAKDPLKYFLKFPAHNDHAMVVELNASAGGQGKQFLMPVWLRGDVLLPCSLYGVSEIYQLPALTLMKWRFYIKDKYVVMCDLRNLNKPSQLYRCDVAPGRAQLALCCANWLITDISIREIDNADLPDWFRDPEALARKDESPQRIGQYTVEFLKQKAP